LNFSQNHLDRHADLQEYFTAKCRLFENMRADDYAVLSDDGQFREWAATITPAVMLYNAPGKLFSRNPNHLAVKQVADILNIPDEEVRALCDGFCGVEHRMERVAVIDDVAYVNDSKSTTVEATRWALERVDGGIRLIAGGRDKQLDFAPLKGLVAEKVRTLIVIGEAAEKLASVFRGETEILPAASLAEAVYAARSLASSGETVLLSPMCASFDMFKNFEDRGKVFKEIVREMEASLKAG
jgi:UDP-N-acetylmuramoylalanine--D-glutamate ligase